MAQFLQTGFVANILCHKILKFAQLRPQSLSKSSHLSSFPSKYFPFFQTIFILVIIFKTILLQMDHPSQTMPTHIQSTMADNVGHSGTHNYTLIREHFRQQQRHRVQHQTILLSIRRVVWLAKILIVTCRSVMILIYYYCV